MIAHDRHKLTLVNFSEYEQVSGLLIELRCEKFPGHFQQFPMTALSYISCSSRMGTRELFSCMQRTKLLLVFSILKLLITRFLKN